MRSTPRQMPRRRDTVKFAVSFYDVMATANMHTLLLHHQAIDAHHMLLAIVKEAPPRLRRLFDRCGMSYKRLRSAVAMLHPPANTIVETKLPLSRDAKTAIGLSISTAFELGHGRVGAEHLLTSILKLRAGVSASALTRVEVDLDDLRLGLQRVLATLRSP